MPTARYFMACRACRRRWQLVLALSAEPLGAPCPSCASTATVFDIPQLIEPLPAAARRAAKRARP